MAGTEGQVETACHREHFFVGGEYIEDTRSAFGGYTMRNQMYVECLTPVGGAKRTSPLVFIHGGGQSGMNWLRTPDGRKGWASYFLDRSYQVYIMDTTSRGRSAIDHAQECIHYPTGMVENFWTATSKGRKWQQAELHTQWPGVRFTSPELNAPARTEQIRN